LHLDPKEKDRNVEMLPENKNPGESNQLEQTQIEKSKTTRTAHAFVIYKKDQSKKDCKARGPPFLF